MRLSQVIEHAFLMAYKCFLVLEALFEKLIPLFALLKFKGLDRQCRFLVQRSRLSLMLESSSVLAKFSMARCLKRFDLLAELFDLLSKICVVGLHFPQFAARLAFDVDDVIVALLEI